MLKAIYIIFISFIIQSYNSSYYSQTDNEQNIKHFVFYYQDSVNFTDTSAYCLNKIYDSISTKNKVLLCALNAESDFNIVGHRELIDSLYYEQTDWVNSYKYDNKLHNKISNLFDSYIYNIDKTEHYQFHLFVDANSLNKFTNLNNEITYLNVLWNNICKLSLIPTNKMQVKLYFIKSQFDILSKQEKTAIRNQFFNSNLITL